MKMGVQQKLISRSIFILFGFIVFFNFLSCSDSDTKADVGYGKSYFMNNCSACHGRYNGFDNTPGMLTMYNYDSLTLLKKLRDIKQDSIHRRYFNSEKYSNKEINSILEFIKEYFEPHY